MVKQIEDPIPEGPELVEELADLLRELLDFEVPRAENYRNEDRVAAARERSYKVLNSIGR